MKNSSFISPEWPDIPDLVKIGAISYRMQYHGKTSDVRGEVMISSDADSMQADSGHVAEHPSLDAIMDELK